MKSKEYKKYIDRYLELNQETFTHCADKIHALAELSGCEYQSSAALCDLLEAHGFSVERGLKNQPTAFRATYGSGTVRVGFLCEYDALASLQQDDVPYKQGNGSPGHGCGHNLLGVGSAAAGIALKNLIIESALSATIVIYGTPAEETLQGKGIMLANGYFHDIDVCLAWHPLDHNDPGEIAFKAACAFTMKFYGCAAHACNCPENGRSALDAAELTNAGVNYLREHVSRDSYMHYSYLNGGERPNIVPDFSELWYMVRADRFAQMQELVTRVKRVAEGACKMTDTTVAFETLGESCDSKLNFTLAALAEQCMREIGTPKFTSEEKNNAAQIAKAINLAGISGVLDEEIVPANGTAKMDNGSSDVADVSRVVPVININTACYGRHTPNHSWAVTVQANKPAAHRGMLFAAKTLALMGAYLISEPALLARVTDEFANG